jgi:hypothetical protein
VKSVSRTTWSTVADSPITDHTVSVEVFQHDTSKGADYEIAVRVDAHLTLDEVRGLIVDLQHALSLTHENTTPTGQHRPAGRRARGARIVIRSLASACLPTLVVLLGAITAGGAGGLALATEPPRVPPTAAHVLAHTRTDCGIDRYDEAEQTTTGRWTDLVDSALRCLLTGVGAPSYVPDEMAHTSPGTGQTRWATGVVDWHRDPMRGLVVTVHVHPAGAAS